jgi:hypothetical protein
MTFEFPQNDTLRIPSYGLATTPLTIKASPDIPLGPYTLFISANSTFPPEQLITVKSDNEANSPNHGSPIPPQPADYAVARSSLVVTIVEPLTRADELGAYWGKIGGPISFVYGALAGISPWVYSRLRNRINNNKQKGSNESQ